MVSKAVDHLKFSQRSDCDFCILRYGPAAFAELLGDYAVLQKDGFFVGSHIENPVGSLVGQKAAYRLKVPRFYVGYSGYRFSHRF